ncbi:CS1 type fimbrial major subunit protein [Candidatus Regiella insecticola 5.15]|uniref:CS1 type fimbrial major subunit protein n=1 Tax=Candidatus Regiella insecticola 5.15 TaxID=1005043 RepID=G2GWM5_9ENTR|nr:CS1 type fimbrial major subunit [Candidatus Regiella insecticola]EGY29837.1 CS1 type fimbrial major subunit protein [Candidatus Regiella insecticola 5.15]
MKNTMVKNKTLLASAILALTAVSSVAYAAPVNSSHAVNLIADIAPIEFYVKPKGGSLNSEYTLAYDANTENLTAVTIPFSHKNRQGKAINANLIGDAKLVHSTSTANTIPLTVTYNGVAITAGASSSEVVAANAANLINGANADLVIAPDDFASHKSTLPSGRYEGTVTISFDSEVA